MIYIAPTFSDKNKGAFVDEYIGGDKTDWKQSVIITESHHKIQAA